MLQNDRESQEDGNLLRTLNELIIVRGNLDKQSYQELVRTYHMVGVDGFLFNLITEGRKRKESSIDNYFVFLEAVQLVLRNL